MAPRLSKSAPPPPQTAEEAAQFIVKKVQPALKSLVDVLSNAVESGGAFLNGVQEELDRVVRASISVCDNSVVMRFFYGSSKAPLHAQLPILFVLAIVQMLYCAFVYGYMPAAGLAFNSPTSMIFHALIFLILSSYFQGCTTDPGSVPRTPVWNRKGFPPPALTETKGASNQARWCQKHNTYKPDRAHNCKTTGQCVLRMDHHCPWMGNTIGFANHKFFLQFLLYVNAACGMLGIGLMQLLVHCSLPPLSTFLFIGAEGLTVLLSSILIPFFMFHLNLLSQNLTTIEFAENQGPPADEETGTKSEKEWENPYDMGLYQNVCSVLGSNPLLWLVPLGGPPGDGLSFQTTASPLQQPNRPAQIRVQRMVSKPATPATTAPPSVTSATDAAFSDAASSSTSRAGSLPVVATPVATLPEPEAKEFEQPETDLQTASDSESECDGEHWNTHDDDEHDDAEDGSGAHTDMALSPWTWMSSPSDMAERFNSSFQMIGETARSSLGHVQSIVVANGRTKRASLRPSTTSDISESSTRRPTQSRVKIQKYVTKDDEKRFSDTASTLSGSDIAELSSLSSQAGSSSVVD